MPKSPGKIFLIIMLLFFAGTFALKQKAAFAWVFDFLPVVLLIVPLFLNAGEFLFFEILSIFFLSSLYPFPAAETVILALLPVFAFVFRRFFAWITWAEPFLISFAGICGLYACISPAFFGNPGFALLDLAVSMAFAWILYAVLNKAFKLRY